MAVQFGKGPLGVGCIGFPLLLTGLFAFAPLRSLSNICQILQPDQAVGVLCHDAFGNDMIGVLLQPSLSSTDRHQTAGSGTSAFFLKTLSQSCVMVGFGSDTSCQNEKVQSPLVVLVTAR